MGICVAEWVPGSTALPPTGVLSHFYVSIQFWEPEHQVNGIDTWMEISRLAIEIADGEWDCQSRWGG